MFWLQSFSNIHQDFQIPFPSYFYFLIVFWLCLPSCLLRSVSQGFTRESYHSEMFFVLSSFPFVTLFSHNLIFFFLQLLLQGISIAFTLLCAICSLPQTVRTPRSVLPRSVRVFLVFLVSLLSFFFLFLSFQNIQMELSLAISLEFCSSDDDMDNTKTVWCRILGKWDFNHS